MSAHVQGRITLVWLLLMAITLGSWFIGTDLGGIARLSLAVVLALTVLKMHLVLTWFMEVGRAPALIRHLCRAWLAALFVAILWIYG